MSPPVINLVFLGCGAITRTHSRTLASFRSEVRCFYASRDRSRAEAAALRFGGAGCFGSYTAALTDERVDTVLVATPPESHLELALRALNHGKNVIVEKPAFLRSGDFELVRAAESRAGRRVMVAENYCYKPLARRLQQVLNSGRLGEIRFVQINAVKHQPAPGWRSDPVSSGGGALFEGGVHWVDLMANLGLKIEAVHGFRPGDWRGLERSTLLVVEFQEGAVGTLSHSWEIPALLRGLKLSHIYGTRGSATFESNGLFVLLSGGRPRLIVPGLRDISGYRAMFRDFLSALRSGHGPLMTLDRAQRGLELVEAAYRNIAGQLELETCP